MPVHREEMQQEEGSRIHYAHNRQEAKEILGKHYPMVLMSTWVPLG